MTCADPGERQPLGDRRAISAGPRLDPDTTVWASTDAGFGDQDAHTPERLLRCVTVTGHGSSARSAQWSTATARGCGPHLMPIRLI